MVESILVSEISEYSNNPRYNDASVEKLKRSIELYGFNQPLILDRNKVIISGHSRLRAIRELGFKYVDCIVKYDMDAESANAFRIVDNKTSEFASWDYESLKGEIREMGEDIKPFFADGQVDNWMNDLAGIKAADITEKQFVDKYDKFEESFEPWRGPENVVNKENDRYVNLICNHCGRVFKVVKNDLSVRISRFEKNIN